MSIKQNENVGIYVHIPFCKRKCSYCDFYSLTDTSLEESFQQKLVSDVEKFSGQKIAADTIYFGGGTPTLAQTSTLDNILNSIKSSFEVSEKAEITIEANPCTVDLEKLGDLRNAGFNRISFGIQSAVDSELCSLGRLHDFKTAENAFYNARKAGFENISVDLMIGTPLQSLESLDVSLDEILRLNSEHISVYMLKIEPGTPLFFDKKKTALCADDDLSSDMYLKVCGRLKSAGFKHYEISNFAREGFESRHNLKYWQGKDYLGFGASAHSFFQGKRFYYPNNLKEYISGESLPIDENEGESFEPCDEYLMLGLRLSEGVKFEKLEQIYGADFVNRNIRKKAEMFEKMGLAESDDSGFRLTDKGFLLSNSIISELIY